MFAWIAAPVSPPLAAASPAFGYERPINPRWFPDDARQWRGYGRSILLTDLGKAEPADALVTGQRRRGKWKIVPYEAGEFRGNALSCYPNTKPAPVRIPVGATGWHAVYVGIGTWARSNAVQKNGARAKLGSASVYRRVANNMDLAAPRRDVIQEQFIAVANLQPGETVDFAPLPDDPANLMYVRLVPLTDEERRAWDREGTDAETRTEIAEFDGHSWIWPFDPRTAEDLKSNFEGLQRTDFGQWWFCVLGADLVCYPSKVGTVAGEGTEDFPSVFYEAYTRSLDGLIKAGINPLLVARQSAREQGRAFHIFIRPEGWGASMPYEETFNSRLYLDHPEWRTVDREGHLAMFMSYAVPQVRRKTLEVFREAVEMADPDGIGFYFNRGIPLMLWEKPFADLFLAEYHVDIMSVGAEDARIHRLRAKIMTAYLRDARAMLDELGKARGGKRYSISAVTFADKGLNERYGLDVETWVKEGLVDQLGIAPTAFEASAPARPDVNYYHRVVAGTKVRVYPYVIAWEAQLWNSGKPEDLCRLLLQYYGEQASGISVWDQTIEDGYRSVRYDGNAIDLLGRLGHRELLAYWAQNGVPTPNSFPLQKFGENEYSQWWPNAGY